MALTDLIFDIELVEIKKILSEKQYKKWLKYQANKKKSLKPKTQMNSNNTSRGQGKGNGRGPGQGRGQGRRRRYRGGLSRNVEFTPEQLQAIQQLDPEFEAKSTEFAKTASKEHEQLALLLETPSTNNNVILQQLEKLLEARAQLERLTSQHVLLIRSHLSPEQQKILVGLSANCGRR